MFKYIKLKAEIKRLKKLHDELNDEVVYLKEKLLSPSAEQVIKNIIGREIGWYDYQKLDFGGQQGYYQNAQSLLNNEVLNNEVQRFIADQIKFIGYETDDFSKIMNVRSGIVAVETLMDRIKNISGPKIDKEIDIDKSTEAI
jgi:hypothetical protein